MPSIARCAPHDSAMSRSLSSVLRDLVIAALDVAVPRDAYRRHTDIAYGAAKRQSLDLYIPEPCGDRAPVLLFFYGGRWSSGSKDHYRFIGQAFASRGIVTAIADYRLHPQVGFPAFVEDGAAALQWLRSNIAPHGGDPAGIFLCGHSAGAYIAAMLACNTAFGASHAIAGAIGIAGPYDFLPLTDDDLIALFGGADNPDTQPVNFVDGPRAPMLLVSGAADKTVSPGNVKRLARRLHAHGSIAEFKFYPRRGHITIILSLMAGFRWLAPLRDDIADFIARHER
jgi:acetyl esterase/lipase